MVPIMDDDFVFTLSDTEGPIQEEEEYEDAIPQKQGNKKRKREEVKQKGKSKAKKLKKAPEQEGREDEQEDPDRTWADQGEDDGALDSDFEFQIGNVDTGVLEDFDGWGLGPKSSTVQNGEKKGVDIDDIIARRKSTKSGKAETNGHIHSAENGVADEAFAVFEETDETLAEDGFGMGALVDQDDEEEEDEDQSAEQDSDHDREVNGGGDTSDDESIASPVPHPGDLDGQATEDEDEDETEDPVEAERRAAFFAPEENIDGHKPPATKGSGSFQSMSLSRPILKGLAAVGFTEPTPIQSKTVPVALLGKDVVGGAVTGSGKTAAFIIPILERLLYRPKKVATTRVAVLMPTRELAVQCFNVAKKLAAFTDITFAQIVGGFSLREQENVLKQRPDVIIATPGRFIDHMRNSPSFAVDTLEILVLDEADRMLEDGFADELNEILTTIPKSRQTMLFSATVTDTIDKLIRVGLNRPVRLLVDAKKQTVAGLVQEFVRLRPGREDKRLAYLLYLCEKVYTTRVIIFFRQKKEAHRVRIVFGLCGLKAAELHGSMTQEQRISAVESFRSGKASFLLATDLASRGLDIKGVDSVINYEAPQSHEIYLHRVGRTARAGRSGNACTLAAEPDRRVVKAAVKSARAQGAKIVSRTVSNEAADAWAEKLTAMEEEIEEVLKEEKEERALSQVEREVKRGENIIDHEAEIMSRPKRTWFESEKEKKISKDKGRAELNGMGVLDQREKRKLSNKEKKKLDVRDERKGGREWKKGKEERMGKGALEKSKGPKSKSKSKPKVKGGKPKGRPSKGRR